ncbi:MAG: 2Fe-2S iron-sulfur cluster binding domain-containing protein [Rhodobacteraceae bacterium]|nr:2Fe-2S iron-sulfur cluster binding domain-containing protein [Paracoccaceae bacterium]
MVKVTYITLDGSSHVVDVEEGRSVMEGATANGIDGIVAECGGFLSCATCHAYVHPDWLDKTGKAEDDEMDMLEFAEGLQDNSRLTCQIEVTDDLDGLIVTIPKEQG